LHEVEILNISQTDFLNVGLMAFQNVEKYRIK